MAARNCCLPNDLYCSIVCLLIAKLLHERSEQNRFQESLPISHASVDSRSRQSCVLSDGCNGLPFLTAPGKVLREERLDHLRVAFDQQLGVLVDFYNVRRGIGVECESSHTVDGVVRVSVIE